MLTEKTDEVAGTIPAGAINILAYVFAI